MFLVYLRKLAGNRIREIAAHGFMGLSRLPIL